MTYKFDQYWVLIVGCVLFGALPVASIIELLTTGTIDLDAVGRGRVQIPNWLAYGVSWPFFLFFLVGYVVPASFAIAKGEIFRIVNDTIYVDDNAIDADQILDVSNKWPAIICIKTENQTVCFAANLSFKGRKALHEFLAKVAFV